MSRLCLVAVVALASTPLVAQVPPDAAIFAHVDVAKLWAGPVGEHLRAAKVPEIDRVVREFEAVTGLTPADVTSATIHWPDLRKKDLGVFPPFVLKLTLMKPLDAGRLVALAAAGCRASGDELTYTFDKGVLTLKPSAALSPRRRTERVLQDVTLDLRDPLHPRLAVNDPAKPGVAAAKGPLSPALAAITTKEIVVGINAAMYPPRPGRNRAEADPEEQAYQTLVKADTATFFGEVAGGKLAVEARFDVDEPADRRECVKALEVLRTLLAELLEAGRVSAGRSKNPADESLGPVLEALKVSVAAATVRIDGSEAVATLSVRADLPFGPALTAAVKKTTLDARDRTLAQTNLKQLGIALHSYHDAYGAFPPPASTGNGGKPLLSWRVALLPFVEEDTLSRKFKLDEPWDSVHNLKVLQDNPMPPVFALPGVTKPGDTATHFRVFVGHGAAFDPVKGAKMADFTDGTSNTLLVVTAAKAVPWTKPDELDFEPDLNGADLKKLLRFDGGGCNVLLTDGSARTLRATIDAETLKAWITRAGGEVIERD